VPFPARPPHPFDSGPVLPKDRPHTPGFRSGKGPSLPIRGPCPPPSVRLTAACPTGRAAGESRKVPHTLESVFAEGGRIPWSRLCHPPGPASVPTRPDPLVRAQKARASASPPHRRRRGHEATGPGRRRAAQVNPMAPLGSEASADARARGRPREKRRGVALVDGFRFSRCPPERKRPPVARTCLQGVPFRAILSIGQPEAEPGSHGWERRPEGKVCP